MTSLDRALGVYAQPAYWIEYYEDGQIISQGQLVRLIAVLYFPPDVRQSPVPFGVVGLQEGGGWFRPKSVNFVAVGGTVIFSEHGEDLGGACNMARQHPRRVAAGWQAGQRSRFLATPPPFSPGRLQGSIRHYGLPMVEGPLAGGTLEAVAHLPSGRSVAIAVRHVDPAWADALLPRSAHAAIGEWLIEFLPDWGGAEPEPLNRFDEAEDARQYANDQAISLLVGYWAVESAGRSNLPSGQVVSPERARALLEGMLAELRGPVVRR